MAGTTVEVAVSNTAYTLVCDSSTYAFLFLIGDGPFKVSLATSQPDPSDPGAVMVRNNLEHLNFSALGTADMVYAMSLDKDGELLGVMKDVAA